MILDAPYSLQSCLDVMGADALKEAARAWGAPEANKLRRGEALAYVTKALFDPLLAHRVYARLTDPEKLILRCVSRLGGYAPGKLLAMELKSRALPRPNLLSHRDDPVRRLMAKLLLIKADPFTWDGGLLSGYSYPDVMLAPALRPIVSAAPAPAWRPSAPARAPATRAARSPSAVALDLTRAARHLASASPFAVNKHGQLPRPALKTLAKVCAAPQEEPYVVPDPEGLLAEIVLHTRAASAPDDTRMRSVDLTRWEDILNDPIEVQAQDWVRGWCAAFLWQDGIGLVPDKDDRAQPLRITPESLRTSKRTLLWVLMTLAEVGEEWLDLEDLMHQIYQWTGEQYGISLYWKQFRFAPTFVLAAQKQSFPAGAERSEAFWMEDEATWVANVLLCTFFMLGLVERGHSGAANDRRHLLRLTELGRAAFASGPRSSARMVPNVAPVCNERFLVIQANHEILAHLEDVPPATVLYLDRFAREIGPGCEQTRTYVLEQRSVYQALEGGMDAAGILGFLARHGRNPVPDNVARSLHDWAARREAVTVRSEVDLVSFPDEAQRDAFLARGEGRPLGRCCALVSAQAAQQLLTQAPKPLCYDHAAPPPTRLAADDIGQLSAPGAADLVVRARMGRLASVSPTGWTLLPETIAQARRLGISQPLATRWLRQHLGQRLPPAVEISLRAWGEAAAPPLQMTEGLLLHLPDPLVRRALLESAAFRAYLQAELGPEWLLLHPSGREGLGPLLQRWGLNVRLAG